MHFTRASLHEELEDAVSFPPEQLTARQLRPVLPELCHGTMMDLRARADS
jgi:hypothetical protein